MNEERQDGGPAFPVSTICHETGMSLRDYFAVHCPSDLASLNTTADAETLIGEKKPGDTEIPALIAWNSKVEAALRYAYADAMLKARSA